MNDININDIEEFLWKVNLDFPIPLDKKVDLSKYSVKLYNNATIKVEFKDNKICGMVAGYTENLEDNISYISIVAVDKENRGYGIASKLVELFLEDCKNKNIRAVHLYTHKTNIGAIKIYKKIGFREISNFDDIRNDDIHLIKYLDNI